MYPEPLVHSLSITSWVFASHLVVRLVTICLDRFFGRNDSASSGVEIHLSVDRHTEIPPKPKSGIKRPTLSSMLPIIHFKGPCFPGRAVCFSRPSESCATRSFVETTNVWVCKLSCCADDAHGLLRRHESNAKALSPSRFTRIWACTTLSSDWSLLVPQISLQGRSRAVQSDNPIVREKAELTHEPSSHRLHDPDPQYAADRENVGIPSTRYHHTTWPAQLLSSRPSREGSR